MQAGDLVVALHMPHWGLGIIEWVGPANRLIVGFEVDGEPIVEEFDAHELENAPPLGAAA